MSVQQSIAIERSKLPSPSAISSESRALGFDLVLEECELDAHSGYLPARLDGDETGFEWFISNASEYSDFPLPLDLEQREIVIELSTGSDEKECQAAMICAAAIMKLADGVYFDDYENIDRTPDRLLAEVREWMGSTGTSE